MASAMRNACSMGSGMRGTTGRHGDTISGKENRSRRQEGVEDTGRTTTQRYMKGKGEG